MCALTMRMSRVVKRVVKKVCASGVDVDRTPLHLAACFTCFTCLNMRSKESGKESVRKRS